MSNKINSLHFCLLRNYSLYSRLLRYTRLLMLFNIKIFCALSTDVDQRSGHILLKIALVSVGCRTVRKRWTMLFVGQVSDVSQKSLHMLTTLWILCILSSIITTMNLREGKLQVCLFQILLQWVRQTIISELVRVTEKNICRLNKCW